MKKRRPASEFATKMAQRIALAIFGKHCVQTEDVETIAAVVDEVLGEARP